MRRLRGTEETAKNGEGGRKHKKYVKKGANFRKKGSVKSGHFFILGVK